MARTSSRRALLLVLVGAFLLAAPTTAASAHPNASADRLVAGSPAVVRVLLFADEGDARAFRITVPTGARLVSATGDGRLPVVTTSGGTATYAAPPGRPLQPGQFAAVALTVVPDAASRLVLHLSADLAAQPQPYVYPPLVVGAVEREHGSRLPLVRAGLLAVGVVLVLTRTQRRRARRARLRG